MNLVLKKLGRYLKQLFKKTVFLVLPELDPIFPVEKIIRSIPEAILNDQIARHVKTMTVIRNACVEKYKYTEDLPPAFRSEMHFATRHVYRMIDVTVNVKTGVCFTLTHGFLESLGSLRGWMLAKPIRRKNMSQLSLNFPVTCINTTGYAHFIMEELPRLLWALKLCPDLRLICPVKIPGYISAIYAELRKKNILQFDPITNSSENIMLNDYIFTQAEAYSGFWNKLDIKCLRNTFLKPFPSPSKNNIYISRRHSSRSFSDEAALEEALTLRGFQIVFLEKLKFTDQIEIFSNAAIVVAAHGAGLANVVWCSPDTKIVEIFTDTVFNDCFSRLSSQLSCVHHCLGWKDIDGSRDMVVSKVIELLDRI